MHEKKTEKKQVKRATSRNTENEAYEDRRHLCSCWCTCTVKKGTVENIKKVSNATMIKIQKMCMLGSARILRKVLSV